MNVPAPGIPPTDNDHITRIYSPPPDRFPPPDGFPEERVSIFVGDGFAAVDARLLDALNIRSVLNVAYNLDDDPRCGDIPTQTIVGNDPQRTNPPPPPVPTPLLRSTDQQYAKVGIIDGTGNVTGPRLLMAAVYMADQLFSFLLSEPPCPSNTVYQRGNLLIHCHSGHSRSVTVASLYIWYRFGVQAGDPTVKRPGRTDLENFHALYRRVQEARGDHPKKPERCAPDPAPDWFTPSPPSWGMQAAAHELVARYAALFPEPQPR
jgi:hypothetical protein